MGQAGDFLVKPSRFWRQRAHLSDIDPPPPFHVRLDSAVRHIWAGMVAEPGHMFDGQPVYLSQRNKAWTGEVTVEVSPANRLLYRAGYGLLEPSPAASTAAGIAAVVDRNGPLTPAQALLMFWEPMNYPRLIAHGEAEVASLETHYGVPLPPDFRDYLLKACSTLDDGGLMDDFNSWWGLERIRSIVEESDDSGSTALAANPAKILIFADHIAWCWAWAICCDGGPNHGRVMIVGSPDRWVADSFDEFVTRYIGDQQSLY